jgi:hypothetical protein
LLLSIILFFTTYYFLPLTSTDCDFDSAIDNNVATTKAKTMQQNLMGKKKSFNLVAFAIVDGILYAYLRNAHVREKLRPTYLAMLTVFFSLHKALLVITTL